MTSRNQAECPHSADAAFGETNYFRGSLEALCRLAEVLFDANIEACLCFKIELRRSDTMKNVSNQPS